jgi:hypothetical protein
MIQVDLSLRSESGSLANGSSSANGSAWNPRGNLPSHPFACLIKQSNQGKDEEEHSGEAIPLVIS